MPECVGREVVTDIHARYFGLEVNDQTLTPGHNPRIGPTFFEDWLSRPILRTKLAAQGRRENQVVRLHERSH
jgi:hypothetical protein